jgi:hypothetical protein
MNRRRVVVQTLGLGAAWPLLRAHAALPCPPALFSAQGGTSSTASCGQPVAGALQHGQAFNVVGSGFGTRADYNVDNYTWQGQRHMHFRFGDLARGFPANNSPKEAFLAALQGFFPASSFNIAADYQSLSLSIESGGPSRSGKFLRKVGTGFASYGALQAETNTNPAIPSSPNAYTCYKLRYTGDGKLFRWWHDGVNGSPNTSFYIGGSGVEREFSSVWPYTSRAFYEPNGRDLPRSVWARHEVTIHTAGSKFRLDGVPVAYSAYKDGVGTNNLTVYPLVGPDDTSRNLKLNWPNSVDAGGVVDITDIYYDFTAARVEVSDGTHAEIQMVTAWSNTQIACVFNKGELASGAGTVRVYDANDQVIHSAPITIA